jgi:hypothetical protein
VQLPCAVLIPAAGVHEFNWDVSGLAALSQLRQLELHNPFLKEVWGLAPCTAAHLAPLTTARHLTSLTISTLRLPLLSDVMAAAGLAPNAAALVSGPGKPAAAAAALGAIGGPAFGDMVTAIAVAAVAAAMRNTAQPGTAAAIAAAELQEAAAAAIGSAAAQVPHHFDLSQLQELPAAAGQQQAAEVAADAGLEFQQQHQQHEEVVGGSILSSSRLPCGPAGGRLARKVVQAVAAHISGVTGGSSMQLAAASSAAAAAAAEPATPFEVRSARHAAIALATALAPCAAAAAAATLFTLGGAAAPPGLQAAVQQQALHAGAAAAAGDNPLAPVVAGGGAPAPALGFVAVPVVPPPPPQPAVAQAAAVLAAMAGAQQPQQLQPGGMHVPPLLDSTDGLQQQHLQRQRAASAADIAGAAAAAAASAAGVLLGQLPALLQLRRLTVGTTHGKFMSGVSLAALAPNLTAFEDLSEIMRQPLYASECTWGRLLVGGVVRCNAAGKQLSCVQQFDPCEPGECSVQHCTYVAFDLLLWSSTSYVGVVVVVERWVA